MKIADFIDMSLRLKGRTLLIISILVVVVATFLRLWNLDIRPLHHDEGVNGYFLLRLIREHTTFYDPANYHGPTLFYFGAITCGYMKLFFGDSGINVIAIRLVPAIFGVITVCLVLNLRDPLGRPAAILAAALLAVSPGAVFFSRYYIHETPFVCLTLTAVIAAVRFAQTNRPKYLISASIAAAFVAATKETVIITFGVLSTALVITLAARHPQRMRPSTTNNRDWTRSPHQLRFLRDAVPGTLLQPGLWILAFGIFAFLLTVLYSSFFRNYPKGIYDALRSLQFWTTTAKAAHVHPWYTYLKWLYGADVEILLLGLVGCGVSFWRGSTTSKFFALWGLGMLAGYSILPYKAPWLTLNMLVPLAITAGTGAVILWRIWEHSTARTGLAVMVAIALTSSSVHAIRLNFTNYDDDSQPYVYAHTKREIFALLNRVDTLVKERGGRDVVTICVAATEYWPLPWYLRQYRAAYPGDLQQANEALLIASHKQWRQFQMLANRYDKVGAYPLRPGVELILFVKK